MSLAEEKHLLAKCYGYAFIGLAQLCLTVLASVFHNDITPRKTAAYKNYHAAASAIGGLAFLLILVQVYVSVVFTFADGPKIVIVWLIFAQLAVTAYYSYLPFQYLREDGINEKDEWFMVDEQNLEDLETGALSEKTESTSPKEPNTVAGYGTGEFVQMSGPGAAYPV
ncbi:hypothetical protein FBEOM_6683 [Fusarium beomiforme]|uniref:Uncharacterized protein n=1 Tax=Fusarium beomiforme TaxID=44412 RepID=A0A9P5AJ86_9HYPO|nr:hypothetical protein FBEOM_6683 [Fusarium beomiforme]